MSYLAFHWQETTPLAAHFVGPFVRASLITVMEIPHVLTLWHNDKIGLRVSSTMHDVTDRVEVGVLGFSTIVKIKRDGAIEELPISFGAMIKPAKLLISESGTIAESGLALKASDGKEIIIVAGVLPYSIAIKGIFNKIAHIFELEYMLEHYRRIEAIASGIATSG